MTIHGKFRSAGGLLLAVLATPLALSLVADEPATARRTAAPGKNLDAHFASCLILANQNEIAAAKLAQQRSENPQVKSFAQMLEKDHQQFLRALEPIADNRFDDRRIDASTGTSREDSRTERATPKVNARKDDPTNARKDDPTAGNRRTDGARANVAPDKNGDLSATFLQIKREMADECLASTQRELSGKEGRELDACYVGMQIGKHMAMVDELKVLQRHASGDLKETLGKGLETAQRHLDHGKKLMKEIDDAPDRKTTAK